jgi:hypothetical protein
VAGRGVFSHGLHIASCGRCGRRGAWGRRQAADGWHEQFSPWRKLHNRFLTALRGKAIPFFARAAEVLLAVCAGLRLDSTKLGGTGSSEAVAIDMGRLEDELLQMTSQGAPGREFCESIAELARQGRLMQLRDILPAIVFEELLERYKENPGVFVSEWRRLAQEMRQGFIQHARQRLTSLTRLQQAGHTGAAPAWQAIQRALDAQQNDLLRAAFALELLELVEPAVLRATHLRECVVAAPSSEEADRYLDEATRCYFFGLFTACAVMCRSVLEEAIKQKLPAALTRQVQTRYRHAATLGNLLHEVNNNLQQTGFDSGFPRIANLVNDTGKKAVHQGLLSEDEARQCLQNAREALQLLLGN